MTMADSAPLVRIRDVHKHFTRGSERIDVLQGVNVDIPRGEFLALMSCNGPGIVKVPDTGADPDLVDGIVFNNPALIGTPFADITHAGWVPGAFFDAAFPPNGSLFVLAATFTFVFVDANGNPTDIDRNHLADTAFRETYYNLRFAWRGWCIGVWRIAKASSPCTRSTRRPEPAASDGTSSPWTEIAK